jgi:hypothetical protein
MVMHRTVLSLTLLAALLGASGCKLPGKKKAAPPPQSQAPTLSTTQTASQNPGPPPPATSEPSRPLPTPGEVTVADNIPPKDLPKPPRRTPRKPPKKTVVEDEAPQPAPTPAPQGQLSASISHDDALHQKVDTTQLIDATESSLRSINRQLNNNEQAMVQHIRSYIKDSQAAIANGDYERAHGLAVKAHLLSDELMKAK